MLTEANNDEVLRQAIVQKDVRAIEILYDRHAHMAYNISHRIVQDAEVAEKILLDTFCHLWQSDDLNTLLNGNSLMACLCRLVRTASIDWLRHNTMNDQ